MAPTYNFTLKTISQQQDVVKLHRVFSCGWTVLDCAPVSQLHRVPPGDSGTLVGPLMQVANSATRYYATLRGSWLPPPFTGPSSPCTGHSDTRTGQVSTAIHTLTGWLPPVFLLNSRSPRVTATCLSRGRHPFSRGYGANLPNSLRWFISDTP